VRNGDFNARDFFAISRDTLKRNQFGGTAGGPIRKDRHRAILLAGSSTSGTGAAAGQALSNPRTYPKISISVAGGTGIGVTYQLVLSVIRKRSFLSLLPA
jgi:hypothetical protein